MTVDKEGKGKAKGKGSSSIYLLCDVASMLLATSPGLYPSTTLSELFAIYDLDGDGMLSQVEYDAFCKATEAGAGCDDERWAAHKKTMGVADGCDYLTLRCFSTLYTDKRVLKHYGHEERDLERAKEALAKAAAAKEKAEVVSMIRSLSNPPPESVSCPLLSCRSGQVYTYEDMLLTCVRCAVLCCAVLCRLRASSRASLRLTGKQRRKPKPKRSQRAQLLPPPLQVLLQSRP